MAGAGKFPECTNGHGPMALAADQKGRPIPLEPGIDHGSAFVAYECGVCAYREFHDSAAATNAERRAATRDETRG